jgi:hypothetical protein
LLKYATVELPHTQSTSNGNLQSDFAVQRPRRWPEFKQRERERDSELKIDQPLELPPFDKVTCRHTVGSSAPHELSAMTKIIYYVALPFIRSENAFRRVKPLNALTQRRRC